MSADKSILRSPMEPGDDPGIMPTDRFCDILKLVANPNRLRILSHLLEGETSVGDLETGLGLKQPNLSHELRKLRDHGLVNTRRQSKIVFYTLSGPAAHALLDGLEHLRENLSGGAGTRALPASRTPAVERGGGECGHFSVVHHAS